MFLEMCVLSGCDYVDSIPGIGIKKARDRPGPPGVFSVITRTFYSDIWWEVRLKN
jgi:hypothetical protein